jgi:beta-glucosidase
MKKSTKLSAIYILTVLIILGSGCKKTEKWKNPNISTEKRVADLVSRLTLEEKISQLMDVAAPIERLGIPKYNWWNEGLHGVARAGIATVFPQAIGVAATFNDSLLFVEATAISDEFRAKYNDFVSKNRRERYEGLTVWSPNINIFRDPRWGRGQETYGEDPYLTSRMGVAFVKGMQGNNETYLKTVATPKHYAVHSGPESLRHVFNADVSERDFLDTYLPAFEATIREAKAYSIMGAYNRFRDESCSGSDTMLTQILRKQWGFQGFVVSDCDAIGDIYQTHKIVPTGAEAAAIGIKAGCDLDCGRTYEYLKEAVDRGLLSESEIDVSVKRLFTARMKLGLFDPQGKNPYDNIPFSKNDCAEHRALSVDVACQTMVLLKNKNNILPLSKNIKSIAVLGPNSNDQVMMYANYNGYPSKYVTPLEGIKQKLGEGVKVYHNEITSLVSDDPITIPITRDNLMTEGANGIKGEYFNNKNFEGEPILTRVDRKIDMTCDGAGVDPKVNNEDISIRWTGELIPGITGKYNISFTGDDGYRVWLNEKLILESWKDQAPFTTMKTIDLKAKQKYSIRIEYYQTQGEAVAQLKWARLLDKKDDTYLTEAAKCDAIIYFGGLSAMLEGEEMPVSFDGFFGGDRTKLNLPVVQTETMKKLKKLGKPIILVNMSGSAIALNWEDQNLDAILQAWYPGQEGGTAIADVLFGDYNPAGRLPVTFYKSVEDLPAFTDYNMEGHTYRYFRGEPLYSFGYGLSYTTFTYSNLQVSPTASTSDKVKVTVDVENSGTRDGDEVVQLYVKISDAAVPVPIHALQGFKRIALKTGEKRTVSFELNPRQFSVIDDENKRVVQPGNVMIFVGGEQPSAMTNKILGQKIQLTGKPFYIQ